MSNTCVPDQAGILNLLSQPVMYVRQEEIIFCNAAAASLIAGSGGCIAAFLPDGALISYRAFDGKGVMELPMVVYGRHYSALVCRMGDADVFVVHQAPQYESLGFEALGSVSQAVRMELSEMFDAASQLFPRLEEQEDPWLQRQAARINKGLYGLLRLAGNLSDAGRCMAGRVELFPERTEITAFFDGICKRAGAFCQASGVTLEYQCPDRMFSAAVDRQKLERATLNLISNALCYTPSGGKILLRVEDYGHCFHIRVTDSGSGVAIPELSAVFNHYTRGGTLPGDPRWGAGLGLPLVRCIANLHHGTVVLNSAEGGGTTVTVSISRRLEARAPEEVQSPVMNYDYAGGHDHTVVELSTALPVEVFDTRNLP